VELPTYNLGELSPVDIREYLQEKDVVMIPIASLEQHGPHLPLLTDTIQAEEIARRAAARAQVLYTPTVWMGYSPQHMYDPGAGTGRSPSARTCCSSSGTTSAAR
jgi:creatinine amidohydrolase